MDLEKFKKRLREYKKKDIIITDHAELQAYVREINVEEVKENIVNPEKLVYAEKQDPANKNKEKYNCYFAYGKNLAHRYIITINTKIIIVTIIKINRDWQKIIERK
jgi:hypothetical protein